MRLPVLLVPAAFLACSSPAPAPLLPGAPPAAREMPAAGWQECLSRIAPRARPDGYMEVRLPASMASEDDCFEEALRRSYRPYLEMRATLITYPPVMFVGWFAGPEVVPSYLYAEQEQVGERLVIHLERRVQSLGCSVAGVPPIHRVVRTGRAPCGV